MISPARAARGSLVHATPRVGDTTTTRSVLARHGLLWAILGPSTYGSAEPWFWCRSVASNYTYEFHASELQEAGVRQHQGKTTPITQ